MDRELGSEEARCHCGHLVAILRKTGVELKCKRCKRLLFIPFEEKLTLLPMRKPTQTAQYLGDHEKMMFGE